MSLFHDSEVSQTRLQVTMSKQGQKSDTVGSGWDEAQAAVPPPALLVRMLCRQGWNHRFL